MTEQATAPADDWQSRIAPAKAALGDIYEASEEEVAALMAEKAQK